MEIIQSLYVTFLLCCFKWVKFIFGNFVNSSSRSFIFYCKIRSWYDQIGEDGSRPIYLILHLAIQPQNQLWMTFWVQFLSQDILLPRVIAYLPFSFFAQSSLLLWLLLIWLNVTKFLRSWFVWSGSLAKIIFPIHASNKFGWEKSFLPYLFKHEEGHNKVVNKIVSLRILHKYYVLFN